MKILLTYGDATIRQKDIECLSPGCWLNDNCLTFYWEHLKRTDICPEWVELLDPNVAAFLVYESEFDTLNELFDGSPMFKAQFIVIPVNDNTNKYRPCAGSHWTLLCYDTAKDTFLYFDSGASGGCLSNAQLISKRLSAIYKKDQRKMIQKAKVVILDKIRKQTNTFDCGMFCLLFGEIFVELVRGGMDIYNADIFLNDKRLTSTAILNKREEIQKTIKSLIAQSK